MDLEIEFRAAPDAAAAEAPAQNHGTQHAARQTSRERARAKVETLLPRTWYQRALALYASKTRLFLLLTLLTGFGPFGRPLGERKFIWRLALFSYASKYFLTGLSMCYLLWAREPTDHRDGNRAAQPEGIQR